MSQGPGKVSGTEVFSSPNLSAWSARLEAAQSARMQSEVENAASSLKSGGAAGQGNSAETAKVREVSQQFESIFLGYLMKTLRSGGPRSGFLGDSQAEKIFTEMRDEELAKGMAKAGGIGLAKLLEQQLLQSLKGRVVPSGTPPQAQAIPLYPEKKPIFLPKAG
jgi:flagellar protein FlgJ